MKKMESRDGESEKREMEKGEMVNGRGNSTGGQAACFAPTGFFLSLK